MKICILIFAVLFANAHSNILKPKDVKKAFDLSKITPILGAPTKYLEVLYPCEVSLRLGNRLTPSQTSERPIVKYEADPRKFYTLIAVDLDEPSRDFPLFREVKHWIVVNICGNDLKTGQELISYYGPLKVTKTDYHRHVFLVYEQPDRLDFSEEPKTPTSTYETFINFNSKEFAAKYCLDDPIAGNFFFSVFDA